MIYEFFWIKNNNIYISTYELFQAIFTGLNVFFFVTSLHANEKECFEKASRAVFKFNQTLDNVLIGPLAKGYNKLPEPIRKGTGNFTSNIARLLNTQSSITGECI